MNNSRDRFIHFSNIDNYRRQLRDPELSAAQREEIRRVLAEAEERGRTNGWQKPLV